MTAPIERLLAKLPDARAAGKGWSARCPAHDDGRASLSIAEGDDGRALVKCHAGCKTENICAAVGLRMAELMPTADKAKTGGHAPAARTQRPARYYESPDDAVAALAPTIGECVGAWPYHAASGGEVGMVLRFAPAGGGKEIRPLRRDGRGWRVAAMREPRPLYRLPSLVAADTARRVDVVEGEKCADALAALGLLATTSSGGASAANKTDWSSLAGRRVTIWPDADQPGERYARDVAQRLTGLSPPATVRIARLPGAADGGDVADYIGASRAAAVADDDVRDELERLAEAAPEWAPTAAGPEPGPVLECLAHVEPRAVEWLWPGRIPAGRITLLVGRPGEGKSYLTIDLAARVTTGTPWPDGTPCERGSVLLLTAEDDPGDTIRPRLDAHYADVARVHLLSAVRRVDDEGTHDRPVTLTDVDAIAGALERLGDCRLVIVDPIGSYLGGRVDAHRDNEVRAVLAPIAALAERYAAAVLVVAHRRKSAASIADDLTLGSRAFSGIARAVWHLSRDHEDKSRRLLLPGKNNLACEGNGLAFSILGEPPRIVWEREPIAMSADDGLAAEYAAAAAQRAKPGPEAEALEGATAWLAAALADGPRLAKELADEWCNGQGGSKRTLERAKQSVAVEAYRPDNPGPWWWRLTEQVANAPKSEQLGDLGGLPKNTGNLAIFGAGEGQSAKLPELGGLGPGRVRVTI